ncbi:uncharacterized protein LOC144451761 [Glandiceps talaboti]
MFRIMMAGRSYANVPTSEGSDNFKEDHFQLKEVPKKPAEINVQNLANGSTFHPQHKQVTSLMQQAPPTPPRNQTYNSVVPPSQQAMTSLPPIPQSPASPIDNPYEELPNPSIPVRNVSDIHIDSRDSIDGGDQRFSQPEADQYFMRLNSTMSASSTDGIIMTDSLKERAPRKKKNPTYESAPFERPYHPQNNKLAKEAEANKSSNSCCSCEHLKTYFFIIFIFMLALLALLLVVLVISGVVGKDGAVAGGTAPQKGEPSTDDPTEDLQRQIDQLGVAYQALLQRFVTLEQQLGSGSANASVSLRLARNTLQIVELTNNLTSQNTEIETLHTDVDIATALAVEANSKAIGLNERVGTNEQSLTQVKQQHSNLSQVVSATNALHTQQIETLQDQSSQHNSQISTLQTRVDTLESTFTNTLTSMNSSIYYELDTISKMPGPRGYNGSQGEKGDPGAGDLTACTYSSNYAGSGYSLVSETQWFPHVSTEELRKLARASVFTGVTCSTMGGIETYLETQTDTSSGIEQYRCKCGGESSDITSGSRLCYIHMWTCPATS